VKEALEVREVRRRSGGPGGFGGGGVKPIKAFVGIRWQSVADQLSGKAPELNWVVVLESSGRRGPREGGAPRMKVKAGPQRRGFGPGSFIGKRYFLHGCCRRQEGEIGMFFLNHSKSGLRS
jgi:hypothetical protein